jgi:tetratricopeptide (TPR) repeat protein
VKRNRLIEALEQGKLDIEGTQSSLLHLLKPLDFPADIARHIPYFIGRQWVFDRLNAWLADPTASRLFWIEGGPGVGKTAIAAYLCHKRREVAAFHFCRHGHDDKSDPRRCIMSLAYQLGSQLPDYQQRLSAMDLQGEVVKSPDTLFDNLIVQPLASPFPTPDRTILIVVDALDEATHSGKNELAEVLAKGFLHTPCWLRLLITSRPEPEVMQPLQGFSAYTLDPDSLENQRDIGSYIRQRLPFISAGLTSEEEVIGTMLKKSEGIFLYVEKVLTDLQEGRLTLDRLDAFPQGLGGWFIDYFKRQFPDLADYQKNCRPVLEMITAARGPLPLALVRDALQWDEYGCQTALASLGSLFPHRGGYIQSFHQSVVDWLCDPNHAGPYFVNLSQGRKRLTDVCWADYRNGATTMSSYSRSHLPAHLVELERWEELLELVTCKQLRLIANWIEEGGGDRGLRYLIGLIGYLDKENCQPLMSASLATQVARLYSIQGEYEEAQGWLRYALKATSWFHGRRARAIALHECASLHLYHNEFRQANHLYRRALWLCRWGRPVYHDEAAANLIGLATISKARYRFAEAIRYANRALQEARKAGDVRHVIASERLLGANCKSLGRYEEAGSHLKTAISLSDQFGISIEKASLLLLLGWLEFERAMFRKELPSVAKSHFLEARDIAQHVHDYYYELEAKMSLGWCALAEGAPIEAESWFQPLKQAVPEGRHPELRGEIELGLATTAHQQGNLEKAEKLYKQVISFCELYNLLWGNCLALVGLGAIYWHLGEKSKAQTLWKRALMIAARFPQVKRHLIEIDIESSRVSPLAGPRNVILR